MKWLLVLLVVLFGVWLWRSRRPPPPPARPRGRAAAEMVRCAACGLHLPQAEALTTPRGAYCSAEHRRQIEGQ